MSCARETSSRVFERRTSSTKATSTNGPFCCGRFSGLAGCFEDEASSWTDGLLERLRRGDQIVVPAHWPAEILNGLLVAARRKRIKTDQSPLFWDELARLPIEAESALNPVQGKTVLALSETHGLTVYDAAYLELAHRRHLPLGTLDTDLRKAAEAEGVALL